MNDRILDIVRSSDGLCHFRKTEEKTFFTVVRGDFFEEYNVQGEKLREYKYSISHPLKPLSFNKAEKIIQSNENCSLRCFDTFMYSNNHKTIFFSKSDIFIEEKLKKSGIYICPELLHLIVEYAEIPITEFIKDIK